jgi:serine phosphatase RsbU (regulator of sigma subunit)
MLILTLTVLAMITSSVGWIELPQTWPAVIGLGSLTLCFSVYLTRRVARTNRELEAKLVQVQELTDRAIQHERLAAREEAERRVLEADNARKTAELEEARQLQLAMLPVELPRLDRFDVAVHMSTANEVGGDYYDFHTNGGDSCTLAVGDATGHGLHAGMVVGAAKSLFQTCSREAELASVLQRIGDGLASMHRRQASMAMMLVRLRERHLQIASAGMPPALVWRHANGAVEELMVPSVPLGTLSRTQFAETEVGLEPGDSVLLMSDGLAEVANPAGDLLGYERARRFFAEVAGQDPQAAIRRLLSLAADFHAGTPLQDDMTLVVLKAR